MVIDKIKKRENGAVSNKTSSVDIPVGKWVKCDGCKEIIYKELVRDNLNVCPNCGHYFRMHIAKRLELVIDDGSYKRFDINIDTTNPLGLEDRFHAVDCFDKNAYQDVPTCVKVTGIVSLNRAFELIDQVIANYEVPINKKYVAGHSYSREIAENYLASLKEKEAAKEGNEVTNA